MQPTMTIRRREPRPTPMHRLRLGAARAGAATIAFPGIRLPEPEGSARRIVAGLVAGGLHLALVCTVLAVAWMTPPQEQEKPIPIELVEIKPPPPPPPPAPPKPEPEKLVEKAPVPAPTPAPKPAPAPAPKALAERRSVNFEPSAQAIAPQVVNPSVIQKASPTVEAKALDVKALQSAPSAPTEIHSAPVAVQTVNAVTNVSAPSPTRAVDVGSVSAPAVRGPVQSAAQAGAMVGPKAIAAPGSGSVGAGSVVRSGDGSSVREGAVTGRDVLGSPDGERLANVNTRVGQSNLRGNGEGTTIGGADPNCDSRPEVQAYMAQIKSRMYSRWSVPQGLGSVTVKLRFQLDPGGSAARVELLSSGHPEVGSAAVDALRAASPFSPMNDRVRCLSETPIVAVFKSGESVAN